MKAAVHRVRNKGYYRVLHVPLWIWVFFILPGGLTERLYRVGFGREHEIWLAVVAAVCIWRGLKGRLPGCEPAPYITHYGLEWPNLGYRVVCYTAAWIVVVVPWLLNLIGLIRAAATGIWAIVPLYGWPYEALAGAIVLVAAVNGLPRARRTVYGEGAERAWFYVAVWVAVISQPVGWAMWRLGPAMGFTPAALLDVRLLVFVLVSGAVLAAGLAGRLPRTERYYVRPGVDLQPAMGE